MDIGKLQLPLPLYRTPIYGLAKHFIYECEIDQFKNICGDDDDDMFFQHLLCGMQYSKHFTYIKSFSHLKKVLQYPHLTN